MSIESELLRRFMTELKTEEDVDSLFNDIKECLAQPGSKLFMNDVESPTLARLIEEVKNDSKTRHVYNRAHNRHNR